MSADDIITAMATAIGVRCGMTADQVLLQLAVGTLRHPDAPPDVCGDTDPRNEADWCHLATEHPGEGHNRYAPLDGCRTWTEHDRRKCDILGRAGKRER